MLWPNRLQNLPMADARDTYTVPSQHMCTPLCCAPQNDVDTAFDRELLQLVVDAGLRNTQPPLEVVKDYGCSFVSFNCRDPAAAGRLCQSLKPIAHSIGTLLYPTSKGQLSGHFSQRSGGPYMHMGLISCRSPVAACNSNNACHA